MLQNRSFTFLSSQMGSKALPPWTAQDDIGGRLFPLFVSALCNRTVQHKKLLRWIKIPLLMRPSVRLWIHKKNLRSNSKNIRASVPACHLYHLAYYRCRKIHNLQNKPHASHVTAITNRAKQKRSVRTPARTHGCF